MFSLQNAKEEQNGKLLSHGMFIMIASVKTNKYINT